MQIFVSSLTLRFYARDGWTAEKVAKLLVDRKNYDVTYRPDLKYFAVYTNSGYGVFKKEIREHEFENKYDSDINWYIKDETRINE